MDSAIPTGTVTFLFTDVEGSTRLWQQYPAAMPGALAQHHAILRTAIERHRGYVFQIVGDAFCAAFSRAPDGLHAALAGQRLLRDAPWGETGSLRVRMALHTGTADLHAGDFISGEYASGLTLSRAARLLAAAHGSQIIVSQPTVEMLHGHLPDAVDVRDLGNRRLKDLVRPEHIYQVVAPDLPREFAPLRTLDARPNNLPAQVTSFVGREKEMREVRQQLTKARLVTLTGPGGAGKTRLSLQVGAELIDEFEHGIWVVELAPISDERLLPHVVASALGMKEEAGRPMQETLAMQLRDRQLLIILDNCEHLLGACGELVTQIMRAGPGVRVLATSREHLHVAGEVNYPVPSLAVPDAHENASPAVLAQYEAMRLFAERASAAQPAFVLDARNTPVAAGICRMLDGIPLAIELAAARLRSLSIDAIAARLDDRFRLLTGGDKAALPRQQTLRALIDWSYELLASTERILLQRLAVFAGGWTLEAAEAACAGGELESRDVLDNLSRLVEKSLVTLDAEGERYRLLETVRMYARERLDESGEKKQVRTRHLAYYLATAERWRPMLHGPAQAELLARIDQERENFLAAHRWCDRAEGGAESGLRLVHAVKVYMFNRGQLGLALRMTGEALARAGAQARNALRCGGLSDAGQLCSFMGRYAEARQFLEESLAIARELGDERRIASTLQPLTMAALGRGDLAAARNFANEAIELEPRLGNPRELAGAINNLAQLHRVEGALDAAEPLYERVVRLARELGDHELIATGLLNLAMVSIGRGAGDRARALLIETLAIAEEIHSVPAGQCALEVCAGLSAVGADWTRAAKMFGAAEAQAARSGLRRDPTDEAFLMPLIARARGALGAAPSTAAEAAGRELRYEDAIREAREWLEAGARPSR